MKLYNSFSQTIEELEPIEPGKISMYVCGPTVYNYPHIGNARPIVVFDTLKKALEAQGLEVTYVSNYTDVDDKIISAAMENNVSEREITGKYINAYEQTRKDLHADQPNVTPRVTETMEQVIDFIQQLIDKGAAYEVDGDVYFRVESDRKYGELSHQNVEDLLVGARIDENDKKENPLDFALWKATDKGIRWETPWSKGRPGWHTECVVMIQDVFKKPLIDIHGGGMDLKFPHHENEVAQCEMIHDTHLANIWLHNGMINIQDQKMSKSLGNVLWAKDLIAEYGGNEIRWILISTHYRAPLNLSEESFVTANTELMRIQTAIHQAGVQLQLADYGTDNEYDQSIFQLFIDELNNDLNTPNAIALVFDTMKKLNRSLRTRQIDYHLVSQLLHTINRMLYILGIEFDEVIITDEDRNLYHTWREAVREKDFDTADGLRSQLQEKGIL